MFLGIDIGSSSTKAAILDEKKQLAAHGVVNLGTGVNRLEVLLEEVLERCGKTMEDIHYTVATGYGRNQCRYADKQITEIGCHAKGAVYLEEGIRTVIDIGGQDAKVIRLSETGKVLNFLMNEKCAAGTGRFLEVMSRVLDCELGELSHLADQAKEAVSISNVCTVFAESEVISQLSSGAARADVAKGAHVSVAKRTAGMCGRIGVFPKVLMTGGVALNQNLVDLLEEELKLPITVAPFPQLTGAIGAAVYAWEEYSLKGEK
jgi:predicted CoA-substrate-specific enzyme activase